MAFDIPRNLTQYAEEFLFGLSLKQFIFTGIFSVGSFFMFSWLNERMATWIAGLTVIPLLALGILFVFFDLDGKIKAQFSLKKSLYKTSYFDQAVSSFIDVEEIKDDIVILKSGTIMGVIEVKPLDFFILSKEEQQRVLAAYRRWLKSIDYYVQVLSRSVSVDLENWRQSIVTKASPSDTKRARTLADWIETEIQDNHIRDRRFYIIIPEKQELVRRSWMEEIKSIFTGDYTSGRKTDEFVKARKSLRNNIINCRETLEKCSVRTRRLNTEELLGLYSSYFTNQRKINKTVLSPITEMDPIVRAKHDLEFEKFKKIHTDNFPFVVEKGV
jgi:hypothetical protein